MAKLLLAAVLGVLAVERGAAQEVKNAEGSANFEPRAQAWPSRTEHSHPIVCRGVTRVPRVCWLSVPFPSPLRGFSRVG